MLGRDGDKPTINDVARIAGVSKKTVSRVINRSPLLNPTTRDKVEGVIAELGYVPNPQARALALRRNYLVGLIHDNPNTQMIINVEEGLLEGLAGTDFALVVRPLDRHSPKLLDEIQSFIEKQRLYGVLILPPLSENDTLAELCRKLGCRYVRMGSAPLDDHAHLVQSNDRQAAQVAVEHLIELGHTCIGHVAGPRGFRSASEREAGYRAALAAHGLEAAAELTFPGNYTFDTGRVAAARILDSSPRPTAIFAANDEMAAGVLYIARQRGIAVPEELSIVGYDDTSIAAHVWPPLTTIRWPMVSMARSAARKLVRPEAAADEPSLFLSDLIRRGSATAPRVAP
jgi:LacI family transcriptional regulator